jgi:hypothetical protein
MDWPCSFRRVNERVLQSDGIAEECPHVLVHFRGSATAAVLAFLWILCHDLESG